MYYSCSFSVGLRKITRHNKDIMIKMREGKKKKKEPEVIQTTVSGTDYNKLLNMFREMGQGKEFWRRLRNYRSYYIE